MANHKNQGGVAERQRGQESGGGVLGAVSDTVSGAAHSVAGAAQGAASNVASAAGQAWDATSTGAQQAASAVTRTAEDAWSSVRGCMSRYPFATFFAGVGLGALAVLAMQRRRW